MAPGGSLQRLLPQSVLTHELVEQLSAKIVEIASWSVPSLSPHPRPAALGFFGVNLRRVYRLYIQAQLAVRQCRKLRRAAFPLATHINRYGAWSSSPTGRSIASNILRRPTTYSMNARISWETAESWGITSPGCSIVLRLSPVGTDGGP